MARYSMRRLVAGTLVASVGLSNGSPVGEPQKLNPEPAVAPRDTAGVAISQHYFALKRNMVVGSRPRLVSPARFGLVDIDANPAEDPKITNPAAGGAASGVDIVRNVQHQAEYVMDVTFDGKNYSMIVDTGSSDTWLASSDFKCYTARRGRLVGPVTAAECGVMVTFSGTPSGGIIEDQHMNITYGSGHYLNGLMGYASVGIAGVSVPKLQISLATSGYWRGDGISSGILGLGLPALTTAYTGPDRSRDGANNEVIYDPLVTAMAKNGIPPLFSLALSRNHSESYIAFGGVPPNVKTDSYASAPMRKLTSRATGKSDYVYYLVVPEAVVYNSSQLSGKAAVLPNAVVDSGTTQILLSPRLAADINAMYTPHAVEDPDQGGWFVPCNATPPTLGFQFGGKMFYTLPQSMIMDEIVHPESPKWCLTAVNTSPLELAILGDAFMQGLNVVFDVGDKKEIRFANRL